MTAHDRIEINPEIMGGKPVIRGTRVPVEMHHRSVPPQAISTAPRSTGDGSICS